MTDIKGSDIITADPKDQTFDPHQKKFKRYKNPEKMAMKAEKAKLKKEQRDKLSKAKLEYTEQKGLAKQSINVFTVSLSNQKTALKKQVTDQTITKAEARIKYRLFKIDAKAKLQTELNDIFRLTPEELKRTFSFKFQKWFFGVGKEFSRVTWTKSKRILTDFGIILLLVAILALIFLGLDAILQAAHVLG